MTFCCWFVEMTRCAQRRYGVEKEIHEFSNTARYLKARIIPLIAITIDTQTIQIQLRLILEH